MTDSPTLHAELLERSGQLGALSEALESARRGAGGRMVLVEGEAGAGKTALIRGFLEGQAMSKVLLGACDPLFTPSPLGPIADIVEATGGKLQRLVRGQARPHEIVSALIEEMTTLHGSVLVLEDVHWADEATLDILRLLGRRVETAPALVVVSYRDDELVGTHPLRIVLGELATSRSVDRLEVSPLSRDA